MERYGEKELGKVHLTSHLLTVGIPESCTALLYDVKAVINNPSNQTFGVHLLHWKIPFTFVPIILYYKHI